MQPLLQEDVVYPSDSGVVPAFLAVPAGEGPHSAVIVVHEVFGLNSDIRRIARRFANAGYAALAPDLFAHGLPQLCVFRVLAQALRSNTGGSAVHDLRGAIDFLHRRPDIDAKRIGAIGFCMGGGLTLLFASNDQQVRAASVFYGMPPKPIDMLARACPVVGSYGADDPVIKSDTVQRIERTLTNANIPNDIKIYADAGHGFFNDGRRHREPQSQDAWQRTLAFFEQHL